MKIAITILAVLIGLLSIAAGAAKVALVPEEIEFLGQFGFTDLTAICFGIVQILGGICLFVPLTRLYGAIAVALAFALSLALILSTGDLVFAGLSAVPVALACIIIYRCVTPTSDPVPDKIDDIR